jgi:hypothetical protein
MGHKYKPQHIVGEWPYPISETSQFFDIGDLIVPSQTTKDHKDHKGQLLSTDLYVVISIHNRLPGSFITSLYRLYQLRSGVITYRSTTFVNSHYKKIVLETPDET